MALLGDLDAVGCQAMGQADATCHVSLLYTCKGPQEKHMMRLNHLVQLSARRLAAKQPLTASSTNSQTTPDDDDINGDTQHRPRNNQTYSVCVGARKTKDKGRSPVLPSMCNGIWLERIDFPLHTFEENRGLRSSRYGFTGKPKEQTQAFGAP